MKRIYSLNLIAYLRSEGFTEVGTGKDEEHGKVFYSFEETPAVTQAIKEYKNPQVQVNLHAFVSNFKDLKQEIYAIRNA